MTQAMPVGEIVKLMERGTITLPAKFRKKLGVEKGEFLNVFSWQDLIIVSPIKITPKSVSKRQSLAADWNKDKPAEYLKKVRYNPLEKLWAKRIREDW